MSFNSLKTFLVETLLYIAIIAGVYFLYFNPSKQDELPKSKVPFVYQQF
jgi:hypothetical protein